MKLLEYFVFEVTARSAADLLDIHPNSAVLFYKKTRCLISHYLEQEEIKVFEGEVELDEGYFGGMCKGKRGQGAGGKVAVFGLLKRRGHVYTKIVSDTKTTTLMPIITDKVAPDSICLH